MRREVPSEPFADPPAHRQADFPQIGDRLPGERHRMHVSRRTEFGRKGYDRAAGLQMASAYFIPPLFMPPQRVFVFRGAKIRNLRALLVADPRMNMNGMAYGERQAVRMIKQHRFANIAPMAEIGDDVKLGNIP